jgi:hypothetical protein
LPTWKAPEIRSWARTGRHTSARPCTCTRYAEPSLAICEARPENVKT